MAATTATVRRARRAPPAVLRSFAYWLYQYKRTWRGSVVSTLLNPLIFLTAMGLGLGTLVNSSAGGQRLGVGYLAFIAPGVLAATAMQTAAGEATYPVMASIKWVRTYHAMLATPLGVRDVLVGHLAWMTTRVAMGSVAFFLGMALFGTLQSGWAILALPAAILTGVAFVTPIAAFAAAQESESHYASLFRFGIMPMFLFSGVFFPLAQVPGLLRPLAYVTPLWHGVDLCRGLTLGVGLTPAGAALHVGYLALWAAVGFWVATVTFRGRLVR
ncbi:MAG TPA: ABC transporter permease [Mycobacteriales bacterium]|nr:ABC transporter permease [Mycobacteriales bacterium]